MLTMKNKKCLIGLGLGMAVAVTLIHLATHIPSTGRWRTKPSLQLQSKVRVNPFKSKNNLELPQPRAENWTKNKTRGDRLKILVASYMRSGSTLCGNILQAHPDVFYVYEPLLYLWDHYIPEMESRMANPRQRTKEMWRRSKPYIPPPLNFLSYMFRCNVTSYNLDFLTNVGHSKAFVQSGCSGKIRNTNVMRVTKRCARGVMERCNASGAVVQKAVRLTIAEAGQLMKIDPSVAMVHLVRDPRGVLLSRMRFNQKLQGEMHNNYSSICQRMLDDVTESRRIAREGTGSLLTVRYEDLAENLPAVTATIYEFVGLDMVPAVREYLQQIASSDSLDKSGKIKKKGTLRKDPFKTAYRWRQDLPFSLVQEVDKTCRGVYQALGYTAFNTEEDLRNMDIPAKLDEYGEGLRTASLVL